jgi:ankyrin repeat protein
METIRLLVKHGADLNGCHGDYALPLAGTSRDFEVTRLLLELGARANPDSRSGRTLLQNELTDQHSFRPYAGQPNPKIVRMLRENSADLHSINDALRSFTSEWDSALSVHQNSRMSDPSELISLLVEKGANVDAPGADGLYYSAVFCRMWECKPRPNCF